MLLCKNKKISQVVIGGIDKDKSVQYSAAILIKKGIEVHLMEDVYFKNGGAAHIRENLIAFIILVLCPRLLKCSYMMLLKEYNRC